MLRVEDGEFKDENGRIVVLRGINFASDVKLPAPGTNRYVNSPCSLEEVDQHFKRLKAIGFNCIRFPFTWDALQPEHPDKFDDEYMDFAVAMVRKAVEEYDFYVFMDPHQDIWSRFSGGSGAPLWTLHAVGFDPDYFVDTQAAVMWDPEAKRSIKMQWASNYHRLVCQTMFTLFFAGPEYAPKAKLNGKNVGVYLKDKFFEALGRFMQRFKDANLGPKFLGWESMNEPGHGLIGYGHLNAFPNSRTHVRLGTAPTPFQAMLLGKGVAQTVETYKFTSFGLKRVEENFSIKPARGTWLLPKDLKRLDEEYGWTRSWEGGCIWELHGVYDSESQRLLVPDYFQDDKKTQQKFREKTQKQRRSASASGTTANGTTKGEAAQAKQAKGETAAAPAAVPRRSSVANGQGGEEAPLLSEKEPSTADGYSQSTADTADEAAEIFDELAVSNAEISEVEAEDMLEHGNEMPFEFDEDAHDMHLFVDKFFVRHWVQFSRLVSSINPDWFQLMQAPVNTPPPHVKKLYPNLLDESRVVYTPHFYDGLTLMLKRWRWLNVDAVGVMREQYGNPLPALRFGDMKITGCFADQFKFLKEEGRRRLGPVPFLMSEIGIPYDMDKKSAYTTGYWDNQIRAMDANLTALEQARANYTLWCYAVRNTHELGDIFAGEDLSIYSKDDERPELLGQPENGIRAAASVIRPSPICLAGEATHTTFNLRKALYTLRVIPRVDAPTVIYVPRYHFPVLRAMVTVQVTNGTVEIHDQKITWHHLNSIGKEQSLMVRGDPQFKDSFYSYFEGMHRTFQVLGRQMKFMTVRNRPGHYPKSMDETY